MFWFDRSDPRTIFIDNRCEEHKLTDKSSKGGYRNLVVKPDIMADFTKLPFPDRTFALVSFDPPHFFRNGENSWVGLKYGTLKGDWQNELRRGFAECFRVLKNEGTLVFKWNEADIPVKEILKLTPEKPLFGNRSGKNSQSHWIVFVKSEEEELTL